MAEVDYLASWLVLSFALVFGITCSGTLWESAFLRKDTTL